MKHLIIIFALYCPLTFSKNSFSIAPTRAYIDLSRPKTESFIVFNNGKEPVRVEVSVEYFPVDSKEMDYQIPLQPKIQDNLSSYVKVSPRLVSLAPGEQRIVRISVRPPADMEEGEHRAHLLFKMLETAMTQEDQLQKENGKKVGVKISFNLEMAAGIIGSLGKPQYCISALCQTTKGKKSIELLNNSKWRFEGKLQIKDQNNNNLYNDSFSILRESKKSITIDQAKINQTQKVTMKFQQSEPFTEQSINIECSF